MALLIVAGFILRKKNIVPKGAGSILSKTEPFLFVPALNLTNQINKCTPETFAKNSPLMLDGLVLVVVVIALVAFACPLGLNTIVYPATYGGETETGASMTVISNILAIITLPLMYYVFMVLL